MSDEIPVSAKELSSRGGKARARSLSAGARSTLASHAARARWSSGIPRATHGSDDHPIRLSGIEIPCYVLDDGRRVITHRGLQEAMTMTVSGPATGTAGFIARHVIGTDDCAECTELVSRISEPIKFIPINGGRTAYGYEATLLVALCEAFLKARLRGGLTPVGERIAALCEIITRGLSRIGIIGLVDEATGYQDVRANDALAKILEAFVAKELRTYMKTFDSDYYREICRLKNWTYTTSSRRPRALAGITNDIVYARLAPGVLDELREKNPIVTEGRHRVKHFQWLTGHKGHPELQKHLQRITGWMETSVTWDDFKRILDARRPACRIPTAVTEPKDGETQIPPDLPDTLRTDEIFE
jgi:hypothetical protein